MRLKIKGVGNVRYGYGQDGGLLLILKREDPFTAEWEFEDGEGHLLYHLKLYREGKGFGSLRYVLNRSEGGACVMAVDAVPFSENDPKRLGGCPLSLAGLGGLHLAVDPDGFLWDLRCRKKGRFDLLDVRQRKVGLAEKKAGQWTVDLKDQEDPRLLCMVLLLADYVVQAAGEAV